MYQQSSSNSIIKYYQVQLYDEYEFQLEYYLVQQFDEYEFQYQYCSITSEHLEAARAKVIVDMR